MLKLKSSSQKFRDQEEGNKRASVETHNAQKGDGFIMLVKKEKQVEHMRIGKRKKTLQKHEQAALMAHPKILEKGRNNYIKKQVSNSENEKMLIKLEKNSEWHCSKTDCINQGNPIQLQRNNVLDIWLALQLQGKRISITKKIKALKKPKQQKANAGLKRRVNSFDVLSSKIVSTMIYKLLLLQLIVLGVGGMRGSKQTLRQYLQNFDKLNRARSTEDLLEVKMDEEIKEDIDYLRMILIKNSLLNQMITKITTQLYRKWLLNGFYTQILQAIEVLISKIVTQLSKMETRTNRRNSKVTSLRSLDLKIPSLPQTKFHISKEPLQALDVPKISSETSSALPSKRNSLSQKLIGRNKLLDSQNVEKREVNDKRMDFPLENEYMVENKARLKKQESILKKAKYQFRGS